MLLKMMIGMLAFNSLVFAGPSCLKTGDCFEHDGKIIDIRSSARRELDKVSNCDPLTANCLLEVNDQSTPILNEKEFSSFAKGQTKYFIPLELRTSDMVILATALSLGTVVFANDRKMMDFIQDNKTETTEKVTVLGNLMGREAIAPIAAGAYFIGAVLDNGKLKQIGLFTVATGLATQIVTEAFKKSFQRMRPNASDSPYDFFEDHNNSFFSGHTSGAFSLATVVAHVYKDKPIVPVLAYGVAALTAYARMHDQKHWATDVMAGAVAGHLVTKILIRTLEKSERTGSGFIITPEVGDKYAGMRVEWREKKESKLTCSKLGLKGSDLIRTCLDEAFALSER